MLIDISNKELFNEIYIPLLHNTNRRILLYGSRDSAKSYYAAQDIIINTMRYKYYKTVLVRNFQSKIRDSQHSKLASIIKAYKLEKYFNITTNPLQITCNLNGNTIIARGLDRYPEALKSIDDPVCIWYEEAQELTYKAFLDSTLSLRNSFGTPLRELFTFNPEYEYHWINDYFFPPKETYQRDDGLFHYVPSVKPNTTILHTTYKDNRFVSNERADILEGMIGSDEYKYMVLGLWGGERKGLIFDNWQVVDKFPEEAGRICYGLDFGYSNDPAAVVKLGLYNGDIYLDEVLYNTGLTNSDLIAILQKHIQSTDNIYADSAEPKSIEEIRRSRFNIKPAEKGKDSIMNGIDFLKRHKIYVTKDSTNVIKELRNYTWQTDKGGDKINKPVDDFNHALDAIRYAATMHYQRKPKKIKSYG